MMQSDQASVGPPEAKVRYRRPVGLWLCETFGEDGFAYATWASVYGRLYGLLMRLAHRYGVHYMETSHSDGDTLEWCHWCGVRSVTHRRTKLLGLGPEWSCPKCGVGLVGVLFEDPWFMATGGHPGDSGAGGNTPQDPVAEGRQECVCCGYR